MEQEARALRTDDQDADGADAFLERALRIIGEGIATPTGVRFFRALVRRTAEAIGARCVFVSERIGAESEHLIAAWVASEFVEGDLELDQGELGERLRSESLHIDAERDGDLCEPTWYGSTPLKSLLAVSLYDTNSVPIGHLGALSDQPIEPSSSDMMVLRVLARRCAAELERKRFEHALEESEARFRRFVENGRDVFWRRVKGQGSAFEYVSPSIEDYTGIPAEKFLEDPELIRRFLPDEDQADVDEWGSPAHFFQRRTRRIVRPDAPDLWVETHNTPVYDKRGNLTAVEGVVRDVTESVEARQKLAEGEAKLRTLVEAIPDTLVRINYEGVIQDVHTGEAGEALCVNEAAVGKPLGDVLPPFLMAKIAPALSHVLTAREATALLLVPGKGEESRWEARLNPFSDEVLILLRDVSQTEWLSDEAAQQLARTKLEGSVQSRMAQSNPDGLTVRELTVLELIADGATDKAIASTLGISTFTVSGHVRNILSKMHVSSRTEAAMRAMRDQLIGP